jgi:hypothetical protein
MAEQDWKEQYKQQLQKRGTPVSKQDFDLPEEPRAAVKSPAISSVTPHRSKTSSGLQLMRKIIVAIWLGITAIQIIIWLLIGVFGKQFPDPWWLWTGVSGGVVVGIIWYISAEVQNRKQKGN